MGQAHHRNLDPQVQWRSGWIKFARGRGWRGSWHARRGERAVSDHGRLYQTHATGPRRHAERVSQARIETTCRRPSRTAVAAHYERLNPRVACAPRSENREHAVVVSSNANPRIIANSPEIEITIGSVTGGIERRRSSDARIRVRLTHECRLESGEVLQIAYILQGALENKERIVSR